MILHIFIEIFICVSMIVSPNLFCQEIVCFLPTGTAKKLSFLQSQQQKYVKISDLSKQLLIGTVYNPAKQTLSFKKGNLTFAPQSTLLNFTLKDGSEYSTKMKYAVIKQLSEHYVPFDDFVTALHSLGLNSIEKRGENLYQIGKGVNPLLAATFAIPDEMLDEQSIEESVDVSGSEEIKEEDLIVSSGNAVNQQAVKKQNEKKIIPKEKILQAIVESADASNAEKCTITGISLEANDDRYTIGFSSNIGLEKYQKPEIRGREVIIRFPDTEDGTKSLQKLMTFPSIKSFGKEQIRNYLLYTVRFSQDIEKAEIKKNSSRSVQVTITLKPVEKIESAPKVKGVWDLDVIVLDPGHGGEDAGAISINGHREKDIALSIAKRAKELLKKELPNTKVVMTRDDDTFVELYRRGQIANKNKGKLFISIHCNSMPTKPHPANGCESYILRPGRNSEAVRVAEKENAAIRLEKEQVNYDDMSEEKLIISTMAQSAFVKFSEKYAAMLQKEVAGKTGLFNRGVNQAGFLVLVGASMPNVLFETGFLSNVNDEKVLASEKGQQLMAEGIVKAIKRYANEYAKNN
ncbi:MAG: N-acetylmuramoyl-L-alanine amidase [Ignavibacteriae bacterium]|nr:N-acetylmuramoyl-L-alanine amidase [Ignavibacteriota bacterium]